MLQLTEICGLSYREAKKIVRHTRILGAIRMLCDCLSFADFSECMQVYCNELKRHDNIDVKVPAFGPK